MTEHIGRDRTADGGWTADDLAAMPEDGVRRELIDGVLVASPGRSPLHQFLAASLLMRLSATCPTTMAVTQAVEIRLNPHRAFVPDVVVLNVEAVRRTSGPFAAHEVILAVEIVSPASQAMDRITKPALYAGAGIAYYWRIEIEDGISVHTYRIDPVREIYRPHGTYAELIGTDEPWPMEVAISDLIPPYFSGHP